MVVLFLKDRRADAVERKEQNDLLIKAINRNTASAEKSIEMGEGVKQATDANTTYLKERNGRDGEKHVQDIKIQKGMIQQLKDIPRVFYSTELQRTKEFKSIMEAITSINVKKMNVAHMDTKEQNVHNLKVEDKEEE